MHLDRGADIAAQRHTVRHPQPVGAALGHCAAQLHLSGWGRPAQGLQAQQGVSTGCARQRCLIALAARQDPVERQNLVALPARLVLCRQLGAGPAPAGFAVGTYKAFQQAHRLRLGVAAAHALGLDAGQ